ncbi:MAG: hypothetical protein SFV81_12040, partial [Pirellulaceae bacterium]|nr:hypothetical protein [Pirellulaceae bacterium]
MNAIRPKSSTGNPAAIVRVRFTTHSSVMPPMLMISLLSRLSIFVLLLVFSVQFAVAQTTSIATAPQFVIQWGTSGESAGQFHSPICIAISANDEVFVADLNNSRVQQFTSESAFVAQFPLPFDEPSRKSCMIGGMT